VALGLGGEGLLIDPQGVGDADETRPLLRQALLGGLDLVGQAKARRLDPRNVAGQVLSGRPGRLGGLDA